MFVADAHRDDGKRFVVRADEKLTAFVELESAILGCGKGITKFRASSLISETAQSITTAGPPALKRA
jgi:hypothetical protein